MMQSIAIRQNRREAIHSAIPKWGSMSELHQRFVDDGVVLIAGALDGAARQLVEQAFQWSLGHPGPRARAVLPGAPGSFYQDHSNPEFFPACRKLLLETGIGDLVSEVLGSENLWLLYEQVWLKEGASARTPWHQDLPYVPLQGEHLAVLWTSLDEVPAEGALEFVRGSHRGPLYNPTAFKADDPSAAMYADGIWPRLPDIEAERSKWPVVSWPVQPGDALIFHPAILHGGAPTHGNRRRRSLSLRFFGDRAYCAQRPEDGVAEVDRIRRKSGAFDPIREMAFNPPGTLFRHPAFPQVR